MSAMEKHLKQLVGGTIRNVVEYTVEGPHNPSFWGYKVIGKVGKIYETLILSDAEGNGPGFLEIATEGAE